MNLQKIYLVIKFEFLTTIKRRSVLFLLFGLPLLAVVVLTVINQLAANEGGGDQSGPPGTSFLEEFTQGPEERIEPDGLVDLSGLLAALPAEFDEYLISLPDQTAAEAAYTRGDIQGYFIIPTDYLESGEVDYIAESNPLFHPQEQILVNILAQNLIDNPELAQRAVNTASFQEIDLSRAEGEQSNSEAEYIQGLILGIGVALLFYLTIMGSAGYLLQSLGKEKQNRVLEILLSSTRPVELLIGKMIGLGAVGLVQLIVWSVIVNVLMGRQNSFLANIEIPELEPSVWFLTISFFLVGYLVYGSLFAGLGAVSPGQKESSQFTFFLMLPTFLPVWFNSILLTAPNRTPAVTLSLFPLTSPIAMPMRLAVTAVPLWQIALSLSLAVLTALGTLYIATRFFRSQNLLSGQSVNLRRIFQALRT
jgi:ABC-2 type transport system permease protein